MVADAKAAQERKEKRLFWSFSLLGEVLLVEKWSFFPLLVLYSLGIHKLVIILYLQCGFDALSFQLVDTVDVLTGSFFFISNTTLASVFCVVRCCGALANGPQPALTISEVYKSIYI